MSKEQHEGPFLQILLCSERHEQLYLAALLPGDLLAPVTTTPSPRWQLGTQSTYPMAPGVFSPWRDQDAPLHCLASCLLPTHFLGLGWDLFTQAKEWFRGRGIYEVF